MNGILGVARAFGDFELEEYITCVPDVFKLSRNIFEDKYLVVACDGLWDVVEDHMVCFHYLYYCLLFNNLNIILLTNFLIILFFFM